MEIGVPQIIAGFILVISGSMGFILASETQRHRSEGPIMFMGRKGRIFLGILVAGALPVFIGSAVYLGFTAWVLCAAGVPLTLLFLGRWLSPIVYRWMVWPIYRIYCVFYRG